MADASVMEGLFREWQAVDKALSEADNAGVAAAYNRRCEALTRIAEAPSLTVKDMALKWIAATEFGDADWNIWAAAALREAADLTGVELSEDCWSSDAHTVELLHDHETV